MTESLSQVVSLPISVKWDGAYKEACALVAQGYSLIWDFSFPIHGLHIDEMTWRSWEFALEHFKNHLLTAFEKETVGCILYRGSADFGLHGTWWPEDKELFHQFLQGREESLLRKRIFCRDLGFKCCKELSPLIPDNIKIILFFHSSDLILAEYSFDYFTLCAPDISWYLPIKKFNGSTFEQKQEAPSEGFLLPSLETLDDLDYLSIEEFLKKNKHLRIIPEHQLTYQWQGLDKLFIFSKSISPYALRKINGFEAAGGIIELMQI